jgi:hypothetical protein
VSREAWPAALVADPESGRVHAVVARHDFFCALVARFGEIAEDLGD